MRRIRVTGPARRDITKILRHSSAEFGDEARQRYRRLIDQALKDLGADANRVGVQSIDDIRESYFLYHLKWSRNAPVGPPVHQPPTSDRFLYRQLGRYHRGAGVP